jgi:hypothetical protein
MEWTLGFIGIILLTIGLIGQAFQMRKIRLTNYSNSELASPNVFMNKSNFKWYAVIGIGITCWYTAEHISSI